MREGRYAFDYNASADRLTSPLIRTDGAWRTGTWGEANAFIERNRERLRDRHGADVLDMLGSSRATNEENYVTQKFARRVLGTNNVDSCASVCHTPTAAAMKLMLGTGAATNSYDDIERARLILVCGANATENHPIVGARIKQAARRGAQLIVVDPRRIELAEYANLHVPLRPGSNVPLFNALAHVIVEEGLIDAAYVRERVAEFDEYRAFISAWTPERAAPICGVAPDLIRQAARLYATAKPALMVHGLGMTEHVQGTEGVMTLVNSACSPATSARRWRRQQLRGQNNVQGAVHMAAIPARLPAAWRCRGTRRVRTALGRGVVGARKLNMLHMMDAAAEGKLKALWAIGYDIALTNPNSTATRAALGKLDLVIVQDLFMNELAREFGHVFLPACSSFEKDGTFMNPSDACSASAAPNLPGRRAAIGKSCATARALGQGPHRVYLRCEIWNDHVADAGGRHYLARLERHGFVGPVRMNTIRARRCCIGELSIGRARRSDASTTTPVRSSPIASTRSC